MLFNLLLVAFFAVGSSLSLPTTSSTISTEYKGWDVFLDGNSTTFMQLLHSGNKIYYFGFNLKTATYFQAAQFCEDIHMKLASIENAEENERIYKFLRDANKGELFWTSGSKLIDGKHWIWMSKGQPVDYINWAPKNPSSTDEHCLAAYLIKNTGLTSIDRDCLSQMSFICEKTKDTIEISEGESKVPQWKTVYENPYMSPNVPLFHVNNKSYFLGRYYKATFQEALQLCKMMQMHLVTITSEEENNRIYKYIHDTNAGDGFWTSGTRMIDGTTWVWMSTAELVDYTNWYTGQPDSTVDHCLQLLFQKDKGLFWVDTSCTQRFFYICEKPREKILFERNGIASQQNINEDQPVLIHMKSRSYYLVTHFKTTQLQASQFCQRTDMELLSITTEEENEEVKQLLLHHSKTQESFWTSARKATEKDRWTWSSGEVVTYSNLESTSSNNSNKDTFCMEISSKATWMEQNCNKKLFFICVKKDESEICSKVPPILNIYVNNNDTAKNISLPYAFFKIANATFDITEEDPLQV